jgi:hypothetical protein
MLKVRLIYLELLGFGDIENSPFLVENFIVFFFSLCLSNVFFLWFVYSIYFVVKGICCALCLLEPKRGNMCNGFLKMVCLKEKFVQ